jgi:BMFP domain-containing protein YqiC
MTNPNKFFEDFSKVASGAFSTADAFRHEMEAMLKSRFTQFCKDMNLVTREEFDVVKAMAEAARKENNVLRKELDALQGKKPATAKPEAKKAVVKKAAVKKD